MKLTDRFIQSVKCEGAERIDISDDKMLGLALRVTAAGRKSWSFRYRRKSDGKLRRISIGEYPGYSIADARTEAHKIKAAVARGDDPAKEVKRPSASAPRTFGELAEKYLQAHASNRSLGEDQQMLSKDILPALEGEPLDTIERADIVAITDAIIARGAPTRANRTFSTIRKILNWGAGKGYLQYAPTFQMKLPAKEKSRERVLSSAEIRIFWRRLAASKNFGWEMRMLLKLLLVTGQRLSEVAGMARHELHFDKSEWHIPGERTKNGYLHIVPLSPLALNLIEKALRRSPSERYVIPSGKTNAPIIKSSPAQAIRRTQELFAFNASFTPHDLRRTVGSGLGELGFSRLIQDKVLNHADSKISSVYDRYAYMKEKREALEAWADHLQGIIFNERPKPLAVVRTNAKPSKTSSPWSVV